MTPQLEPIPSTRSASGYYGVIFDGRCSLRPWLANLWHPTRRITVNLGYYHTAEQAARRVLRAVRVWQRQPYTRRSYAYCRWGHPLIAPNLFIYHRPNGRVDRLCKRCTQARERAYKAAHRTAQHREVTA